MSVHLNLWNLLLTECITLTKQEYLQLYSLVTLLLRLGRNRLDKLSLVNEELWLTFVWSSVLLVILYHQFSSFQEQDFMTHWCLVCHLEAWGWCIVLKAAGSQDLYSWESWNMWRNIPEAPKKNYHSTNGQSWKSLHSWFCSLCKIKRYHISNVSSPLLSSITGTECRSDGTI